MTQAFRAAATPLLFKDLLDGRPGDLGESYPFLPPGVDGIPGPGPDFDRTAAALARDGFDADFHRNWLYYNALYNDAFTLPIQYKATLIPCQFTLGGLWGGMADGPRRSDVMVIGKMPGSEETKNRCNLIGPAGLELQRALDRCGVRDWGHWYVSNLVRHEHPDPRSGGAVESKWIKNCLPLLQAELRLVRPKVILLLGSEAITHVLGRGNNLTNTQGRSLELTFPITEPDGSVTAHTATVLTSVHPAYVLRRPEKTDALVESVNRFATVVNGGRVGDPEADIDHRSIRTIADLRKCRDEVLSRPEYNCLAVDAEWHGEYPHEPGAYIRTIQFSWWAKRAASVVLHDTEGRYCFDAPIEDVAAELNLILKPSPGRKTRVIGHFLNADMPWLISIGVDLTLDFCAPFDDPEPNGVDRLFGWQKTETEGGFDTILACHSVTETSEFKLETIGCRHTTCPRYDVHLQAWKKQFCKDNNLDAEELEGYGPCPDEVLVGRPTGRSVDWGEAVDDSYGCYDADVTRRLFDVYNGTPEKVGLLDNDANGQVCRISFWRSMWSCPAFGEMHRVGLGVDMENADFMVDHYRTAYRGLLAKLRLDAKWPDFNPNSAFHCRELLFGEFYNGKFDRTTWASLSVRPEGAAALYLRPYKSTGKRPKLWTDIERKGEEALHTASCDKEVLQVMADAHPLVTLLRDVKVIGQVGKYVLRPRAEVKVKEEVEVLDEETGEVGVEERERMEEGEYERGMLSYVHIDQSIRSRFSQTKETGRASSWGPPLQNLGSAAEDKYKAVFKRYADQLHLSYAYPLRSIIRSRRKPHPVTGEMCDWVLVDADWTGAELAIMAWQSGDKSMIEHVRRANLKESDPLYYDIHSNVACNTFQLLVPDMRIDSADDARKLKVPVGSWVPDLLKLDVGQPLPATKRALALIGRGGLRTAAKAVVFGYAYGQQAEATYRKARQEGVDDISLSQAQALIDGLVAMYPALPPYFEECRNRSRDPGFLVSCFHRMRRFAFSTDRQTISEQERQAMNFVIQSSVADAMNMAMGHMYWYRFEQPDPTLWYDIALQVHDAVMLECPTTSLDWVVNDVIPTCMGSRVPVYPTGLDGTPREGGPYHLQVPPPDVYEKWKISLTLADCNRLGISEAYAAA